MTRLNHAGFILICCFTWLTANAEPANQILIPVGQQGSEIDIKLPARGLSQAQTLSQFGEPLSRTKPTGTPPIEKWIYADFSVIFEGQWVIHSVIIRKPE